MKIATLLLLFYPLNYLYNFDWPQALSTQLQSDSLPYGYSLENINLFYLMSAIGAMAFSYHAGLLFDKWPIGATLVGIQCSITLIMAATMLTFYFNSHSTYGLLLALRFLLGIVGECSLIILSIAFVYFDKQNGGHLLGFSNSIGIMGTPLINIIAPSVQTATGQIYYAVLVGVGLGLVSIIMSLVVAKAAAQKQKQEQLLPKQSIVRLGFFAQLKDFSAQFWIYQLLVFLFTSISIDFVSIGADILYQRFGFTYETSGFLMVTPYAFTFLMSLILFNNFRNNVRNQFVIGAIITLITYILYYLIPNSQNPETYHYFLVILVLLGVGSSTLVLTSRLLSSITQFTNQNNTGAAFGLTIVTVNVSIASIPELSSVIVAQYTSKAHGYQVMGWFYIALSAAALILTIYMRMAKSFEVIEPKIETQFLIRNQPIQES